MVHWHQLVGSWNARYMIWYDMIWYDMIWYDMIWYDMIWYDMIWYDMIWYDMSYGEVLVDKGAMYLRVTLHCGHLIILWLFHLGISCTVLFM